MSPRMIRARLRGLGRDKDADAPPESGSQADPVMEIDPSELRSLFRAPDWLRDLGIASWLLIGVLLFVAGMVWLLALTETIVLPVLTASIIAAVASPVVAWLARHHVPRGIGAVVVLLGIVAAGAAILMLIVGGLAGQEDELSSELTSGAGKVQSWAEDAGIGKGTAEAANEDASKSLSDGVSALLKGVATGIDALAGLAIFLAFTVLSLFFLLKDGPRIRSFVERHLGLPQDVARTVTNRTIGSLRDYFQGVTIVAAFNGVVIGVGALIFGVPLAGSIAAVNFAAAYIPYLGAWSAGLFTVLLALGSGGPDTAAEMAVVVLLANSVLQQMIQPIVYGASLGIHPLAVLIVTIAGGALFGAIGLILAAPMTAAAVKISADLARARETPAAAGGPTP
jgi:predicted PurR-regulated permease PerM